MDNAYDLTKGKILSKLLRIAVPIMGTQLMQMAYNLTDMAWLGQMDASVMAVAASGLGGMFLWLSQAFMMFGRMGAEIGVSQNFGLNDRKTAQHYAQNATTLSILLGVVYGLVMLALAEPLVALFDVKEADVVQNAITYIRITGIGIPFTFLSGAITGQFNGAGNSRLSFVANALGLVVNMILDPVMILVWGWGIPGAALATILAQIVVCLVFIYLSKARRTRIMERFRLIVRPDRAIIGQIVRWSAPVAVESGAFTLLAMVVTRLNATFGQEAMAVQEIGSKIESLSWMIGGGFSTAVTAFVGQNYGANQPDRIRQGVRIGTGIMFVWGLMVTALLYFFGRNLFGLFSSEAVVIDMGRDYLRLLALCQLPMCIEASCSGAFRGVGNTLPPSLVSVTSNVLRVPLAYLFVALGMGVWGIWFSVMLTASLRGLAICAWYFLDARKQRAQIA